MNIKEKHYSFKMKLNKLDSNQNTNLKVPEIDYLLNEALRFFINKTFAPLLTKAHNGFETSLRLTDNLKPLVKTEKDIAVATNVATLPLDYNYYISSYSNSNKGSCINIKIRNRVQQHDDMFEEDANTKSNFEWKHVNIVFEDNKIKIHTDATFTVDKIDLTYLMKHPYIHNAEDFIGGTYTDLNGNALVGTEECLLPDNTHDEIVDIAVAIASGSLQYPDLNYKLQKINLDK